MGKEVSYERLYLLVVSARYSFLTLSNRPRENRRVRMTVTARTIMMKAMTASTATTKIHWLCLLSTLLSLGVGAAVRAASEDLKVLRTTSSSSESRWILAGVIVCNSYLSPSVFKYMKPEPSATIHKKKFYLPHLSRKLSFHDLWCRRIKTFFPVFCSYFNHHRCKSSTH